MFDACHLVANVNKSSDYGCQALLNMIYNKILYLTNTHALSIQLLITPSIHAITSATFII